jgi:hypothetical protein
MPRLTKQSFLLLALGVTLTGCAQSPEPSAPVEPEMPAMPVVAQLPSDDLFEGAALGATQAVEAYLERSDLITSEGGVSPERMASLVTPEWYPKEEEGFARFTQSRERTLGQTTVDGLQVQLARAVPGGGVDIGVIACVDATQVLVLGLEDEDPPPEVLEWQGEWESFDGTDEEWEVIERFWATTSARWGERDAVVFWLLGESTEELLVDHTEQWWGISRC